MFNADISGVRCYTHFEQNGANGNVESPFVPDDSIDALVQEKKREPKVAPSEYHYVPGLSKVSNNLKWTKSKKKCDPEVRGPMSISKSARNMMVGKEQPEVSKS
jgi:hypothetical protein